MKTDFAGDYVSATAILVQYFGKSHKRKLVAAVQRTLG